VRESLTEWLRNGGYAAESAEDGIKALEKVRDKDFEVVVLDMKMPGMDGLSVLKELHRTNPDTKVIIITAYASVETAVQALKEGAVDYIVKPFEPEKVEESVAKWVGKPKITLGSAQTQTSSPETAHEEPPGNATAVLKRMKSLLEKGDLGAAVAAINSALGLETVIDYPPVGTITAPAVEEEVKVPPAAEKPKPGQYFPPHFWEGCFTYVCGKDTCPFTSECYGAQGRHQRETEKFIDTVNQALLKGSALTEEQQTELEHAKKHHGAQYDAKRKIYFINKAALKNRPGLGGSYFR
jgi:CheY-like chemotaxis protein